MGFEKKSLATAQCAIEIDVNETLENLAGHHERQSECEGGDGP